MISFHLDTENVENHWKYSDNFQKVDDQSNPDVVARIIRSAVASPIIWFEGKRRADRFMYADWMVLDFDCGIKLEEGLEIFKEYTHVVGTTKRHQLLLDKNGDKIDRFRVWLLLNKRCTSLYEYTYNVKKIARFYGADDQAIDGARKFLPCKKIVSINVEKKVFFVEPEIKTKSHYSPKSDKFIPKFIDDMMRIGVSDGQRNYACYTCGRYLGPNGFTEDEILELVMNSYIPKGPWCRQEALKAIKSGMRGR